MSDAQLTCRELVELITDYLEGVLGQPIADRVTQHLVRCGWCATYVDQLDVTVAALRTLPPEPVPDAVHDAIAAALRSGASSNGRGVHAPASSRDIDPDA